MARPAAGVIDWPGEFADGARPKGQVPLSDAASESRDAALVHVTSAAGARGVTGHQTVVDGAFRFAALSAAGDASQTYITAFHQGTAPTRGRVGPLPMGLLDMAVRFACVLRFRCRGRC